MQLDVQSLAKSITSGSKQVESLVARCVDVSSRFISVFDLMRKKTMKDWTSDVSAWMNVSNSMCARLNSLFESVPDDLDEAESRIEHLLQDLQTRILAGLNDVEQSVNALHRSNVCLAATAKHRSAKMESLFVRLSKA